MVLGTCQEVVERLFRSVLLASNMSSYVPKCAKETSDPYFRCYQLAYFTTFLLTP